MEFAGITEGLITNMREPLKPLDEVYQESYRDSWMIAYYLKDVAESLRILTRRYGGGYALSDEEPAPVGYPKSTSE